MNVVCIGGGPGGLYTAILLKLFDSRINVTVYERNQRGETFGFGVVFSDATLGNLAAADPATLTRIREDFAHWDDIEIHRGGEVITSSGHGFCGIGRKRLLAILEERALELGVNIVHATELPSAGSVTGADLIVACDGVGSGVREELAAQFSPSVELGANRFVWLGTSVPYRAFTFLFKPTKHGLFRIHAYRYSANDSTFIAECTPATWSAFGFDKMNEDETIAALADVFRDELAGHALVKNRSIWRNFPTVRCASWTAMTPAGTPVVLLGDAVHTAHFSIGSGTKLAMEDSIALVNAIGLDRNLPNALAMYQAARRPEVLSLQAAAATSLEWFEQTERYNNFSNAQFAYSLMTRSGRVSHRSMQKRDAALTARVERELGSDGARPCEMPWNHALGEFSSRLVPMEGEDLELAPQSIVVDTEDQPNLCVGEHVHAIAPLDKHRKELIIWVEDDQAQRSQLMAKISKAKQNGAKLVIVAATATERSPRLPATPLADIVRNQLGLASAIVVDGASDADMDAAIASGRADLVVVRS